MKMVKERITEEQAKILIKSRFWKRMTDREITIFQLLENRLCMPFGVFHEAVEKALKRPVWTHEFIDPAGLLLELFRISKRPNMQEIIGKLPCKRL